MKIPLNEVEFYRCHWREDQIEYMECSEVGCKHMSRNTDFHNQHAVSSGMRRTTCQQLSWNLKFPEVFLSTLIRQLLKQLQIHDHDQHLSKIDDQRQESQLFFGKTSEIDFLEERATKIKVFPVVCSRMEQSNNIMSLQHLQFNVLESHLCTDSCW